MFMNGLAKHMSKTCYLFTDAANVPDIDMERDIEAASAWSRKWNLQSDLAKCQRLVPGKSAEGII